VETWLFGDSWHELTNGQGEDAQGGQASAGTVDTPCPLCSCAFVVVGPLEYHVIAGEGNAGTSLALSAGHSASFGSSRPRFYFAATSGVCPMLRRRWFFKATLFNNKNLKKPE